MKSKLLIPVICFAVLLALASLACSLETPSVEEAVQKTLQAEATLPSVEPTSVLDPNRPTSTTVPTQLPPPSETPSPLPPTATETPSETLLPEQVAGTQTMAVILSYTPTSTAPPLDPNKPAKGELLVHDTFVSEGIWSMGDSGISNVKVDGNVLVFQVYKQRALEYRLVGYPGTDFYAQITLQKSQCAIGDFAGLLFRLQDPNNFLGVLLDCQQNWRILRWNGGKLEWLTDWQANSAIKPLALEANLIGVQALGNTFDIFINDSKIHTFQDDFWSDGKFGVFVGSMQSGNFTATFDDLMIYEYPK
ncbi:MAG TPA: hypothetical protein PK299_02885 [Anaerolineales bacterium]|nr:hypothetical protein [Anaerolineales bacterium]